MGLEIPMARENFAIRVENEVVHWKNGKAFVFDDTYKHETWNRIEEHRVILLLHFDRPVRFPGNILARLFMWEIRHSPFIGDARRQMDDWETAFTALETKKSAI